MVAIWLALLSSGRGVTGGIVKRFVEPNKFIPKQFADTQFVSAAAELLHTQT